MAGKELKFRIDVLPHQTAAVERAAQVFEGQPRLDYHAHLSAKVDKRGGAQAYKEGGFDKLRKEEYTAYGNAEILLGDDKLLANVHAAQREAGIPPSKALVREKGYGAVNLDIEMETGTGKTYVYIKTIYEMYFRYGWSKFVIVVPGIAIREGVYASFETFREHFEGYYRELYEGKGIEVPQIEPFVYDSARLNDLNRFNEAKATVMIINSQAFAKSFKEGGKTKESRIIYSKRDSYESRKPIEVIAAARPIVILDEPQRLSGEATKAGIRNFKPLFVLSYSATHKTSHNTVYALDALDAYKERLVKRIKVKGFKLQNLSGTQAYMTLEGFRLDKNKPPEALLRVEQKTKSGIVRKKTAFALDDDLAEKTGLAAYQGYRITEISPERGIVRFSGGQEIRRGETKNDASELTLQREMIRETVKSHLEKEEENYRLGIKTLSLFFIDEVRKYRGYDEEGNEVKGVLQGIFEEEYDRQRKERLEHPSLYDDGGYKSYLSSVDAKSVHSGYFSIDKKTGRAVDPDEDKDGVSDDVSAYDLILKQKARLLSFEEPVRFIFSHSALREGWDNPNVFQICTLRVARGDIERRQSVGRGLRLAVNQEGVRMDANFLKGEVHQVNVLTVVANESYGEFTKALQKELSSDLRERPTAATQAYFEGKEITDNVGKKYTVTANDAIGILYYLISNGYKAEDDTLTDAYFKDREEGRLKPLFDNLKGISGGVFKLINGLFDKSELYDMTTDGSEEEKVRLTPNKNFKKKEFQELWKAINHDYGYTIEYDGDELIGRVIKALNDSLTVSRMYIALREGEQDTDDALAFGNEHTAIGERIAVRDASVRYDLAGLIAKGGKIRRRSAVAILRGLRPDKFGLYKENPEEFVQKVIAEILEAKRAPIVEHIDYKVLDGTYPTDIFTYEGHVDKKRLVDNAAKHVTDRIITDSQVERDFAAGLEASKEVTVYSKLPGRFVIPTPWGDYNPDWAIAWKDGKSDEKHLFFVAETKGNSDLASLRSMERGKVESAMKLFHSLFSGEAGQETKVTYHLVATYDELAKLLDAKGSSTEYAGEGEKS